MDGLHLWKDDFSQFKTYLEGLDHRRISKKKGETISAIGEDFSRHYYLLSGAVSGYILHESGRAHNIPMIFSKDALVPLFYPMEQLSAQLTSFVVIQDAELLVFDHRVIDDALNSNPAFNRAMYGALGHLINQVLLVFTDMQSYSGMERLCQFLYMAAQNPSWHYGDLTITQQALGELIGLNRSNTARYLKVLREAGIVETGRNRILVKDAEALKDFG